MDLATYREVSAPKLGFVVATAAGNSVLRPGGELKLQRRLFSLITFCASAALITALALVVLFAGGSAALAVARTWGQADADVVSASTQNITVAPGDENPNTADAANTIIFSGVISDDHCGARHDMGSGRSPAECTRLCVRNGGHYVILSGDKVYNLAGRDDLTAVAGERVTITGSLTGDTMEIKTITRDE